MYIIYNYTVGNMGVMGEQISVLFCTNIYHDKGKRSNTPADGLNETLISAPSSRARRPGKVHTR